MSKTTLPFKQMALLEKALENSDDGLITISVVEAEKKNNDFSFSHSVSHTFDLTDRQSVQKLIDSTSILSEDQIRCFLMSDFLGKSSTYISKVTGIKKLLVEHHVELSKRRVLQRVNKL